VETPSNRNVATPALLAGVCLGASLVIPLNPA
jgi:hypothetical protein